jgi:hypothetical protein
MKAVGVTIQGQQNSISISSGGSPNISKIGNKRQQQHQQQRTSVSTISTIILTFIIFAISIQFNVLRKFLHQSDISSNDQHESIEHHLEPPVRINSVNKRQEQHQQEHSTKATKQIYSSNPRTKTIKTNKILEKRSNSDNNKKNIITSIQVITTSTSTSTTKGNAPITIDEYLQNRTTTPQTQPKRKWAYAFLVSGCSGSKPSYKGFIYNVIVATERLKQMGSEATNYILFVQMSVMTDSHSLPIEEEELLQLIGVQVIYLPKMRSEIHECFYAIVQEKFRTLQLIDYSRVIFLDADIMPICNLDYIFELSEPVNETEAPPAIKPNAIMAEHTEAANAGFFMLQPNLDDWQLLQKEIQRKEEKALALPWPHFDEREGKN